MQEEYEKLYSEFIRDYQSGVTTAEMAGELIAKLAGFFPNFSAMLCREERSYALVCRDEVLKSDDQTGKAVSSVKAMTIAEATDEAYAYKKAKSHIANLEMLIQSAKALQRGLIQELSHANLQ